MAAHSKIRHLRQKFAVLMTILLAVFLLTFFSSESNLHLLQIYDYKSKRIVNSNWSDVWHDAKDEQETNGKRTERNETVRLIEASTTTEFMTTLSILTTTASKTLGRDGSTKANETRTDSSTMADDQGKNSTKNTKLIILWSIRPETDNIRWWDLVRIGKKEFESCEWSDCELSRDRSRVREATIIVFRHHDPYPEWPEVRFPNQTYIHMLNERPQPGHWWLAKFDDRINITWNYRRNADVSHHKIVVEKENPSNETYVPRVPFAKKTKSVMWAVSHCKTYSRREEYAKELAKYIDLDVFGACGTLRCSRDYADRCTDQWERDYKFHLSFENSICPDYITEKFYRPLKRDLVPVVLGGGDYKTAGPPHSYIDVRDYKSPKELANYLKYLANNEDKYNEYFQWKQKYVIRENLRRVCKLCEIAHNMEKWARPAHHDYYSWWMKGCDNDLVSRMRQEGAW